MATDDSQSLTMASIRRLLLRKRRCFLLVFCLLLMLMLAYSWFPDPIVKISSIHEDPAAPSYVKLTMAPVQPKFVVLEQPGPVPNSNINFDGDKLSEQRKEKKPPDVKEEQNVTVKKEQNVKAQHPASREALPSMQEKQPAVHDIKLYKNKSENNDLVKNKTLSQLGVMGEKDSERRIPKIIYVKSKWHLDVSFEDIGNIMKDTAYLNKLKPLNLDGPMLISTRNKTSNFSLSMPLKMGYCDCWERYCFCCVQLANQMLHLNNKTCVNVTFMSKSHELGISFTIDTTKVYSGSISANTPPLLCMGSKPAVSDMCIHFFNMTYRVDRHGLHKSQLLGCTDISLNVYNKTISVFPVDCFQIPGDPNHHRKEDNIILPNFVP